MTLYKQDELFATISGGADKRVFLDWNVPLLDGAVAYLAADWEGGVLDLSNLLVIVPTRAAGRRLREALAAHVAQQNAVVIPPITVPPDFLTSIDGTSEAASSLETLLAWISTLQEVELESCRNLFPVDPVDRGFGWAMQTAMQLERLRMALGEGGLTVASAVRRFGKVLDELDRWKELAALERRMAGTLRRGRKMDCHEVRARAAREAVLPAGVTSVVMLATPDPSEIAIQALEKLSEQGHMEVVVYAPEDLQSMFDGWGRPIPARWIGREISIPDEKMTIHLAANPRAQAILTVELLETFATPGAVAVGVPDPDVTPHLQSALKEKGVDSFNPEGIPFARHQLAHALTLLGDLLRTRSFRAFHALMLNPDYLRAIAKEDSEWSVAAVLVEMDALRDNHLPDTIDDLLEIVRRGTKVTPQATRLIVETADWLDEFDRAGSAEFGGCVTRWLAFLFGYREFHSEVADDHSFSAIAAEISTGLEAMQSRVAKAARINLAAADSLELLLHSLSGIACYQERTGDDLDLLGWLELLWEDAPYLIITGCNDGALPEAIVGDPFLPNQARVLLGMKDNERRLGRDAYLLSALLAARELNGRVDLIVGRTRDNGDPLRPSRLLFQCAEERLPERALQLFQGESSPDEVAASPPWQRAWKLKPMALPEDARIRSRLSVTAFSAFLSCPFRFYLSHGLGMREVDADKQEMNPMEFGNLCHDALERLGRDEAMRICEDESEVKAFLLEAADRYIERRYGSVITVPVRIQLEAARQRLAWAAEVHVQDLALGWRIEEVEWRFDRDLPWEIGGTQIVGMIDRIDRNDRTGAVRVLDYKTSNKATQPADAHLMYLKRTEDPDALRQWLLFERPDGRMMRWVNLQLPLYVLALRRGIDGDTPISAGYFNLPRAAGDTAITTWVGLHENVLEQAMLCAESAAKAILAEEFWPPAAKPRFEDFDRLFFGSAEESVAPSGL
ncbi:MAG: ATP-dependent helicase/nuclease subunit B [Verrucomicrobiales bacterium]|jgi:ATP-dependent helicase/nuclease subunit B